MTSTFNLYQCPAQTSTSTFNLHLRRGVKVHSWLPPSSRVLHRVAQSTSLSLMTDQPPQSGNGPAPATAGGAADACPASAGAIFCGSGGGRGTINTSIQPCLRRRGCCCKCLPRLRGCDLLRGWRRRRWRRRRDALHRPRVPRLRGCNHSICVLGRPLCPTRPCPLGLRLQRHGVRLSHDRARHDDGLILDRLALNACRPHTVVTRLGDRALD